MSQENKQKWHDNFKELTAETGFFEDLSDEHKALYVEKGSTLVVAFENLDDARQKSDVKRVVCNRDHGAWAYLVSGPGCFCIF